MPKIFHYNQEQKARFNNVYTRLNKASELIQLCTGTPLTITEEMIQGAAKEEQVKASDLFAYSLQHVPDSDQLIKWQVIHRLANIVSLSDDLKKLAVMTLGYVFNILFDNDDHDETIHLNICLILANCGDVLTIEQQGKLIAIAELDLKLGTSSAHTRMREEMSCNILGALAKSCKPGETKDKCIGLLISKIKRTANWWNDDLVKLCLGHIVTVMRQSDFEHYNEKLATILSDNQLSLFANSSTEKSIYDAIRASSSKFAFSREDAIEKMTAAEDNPDYAHSLR